jgi:hypothetical protein
MPQPVSRAPAGGVLTLVRVENAALAAAAVFAFHAVGGVWWLFAALFLLPDLSMAGYLAGPSMGARFYNSVHTYIMPVSITAIGWITGHDLWLEIALVWCAHIGVDRALGFGLKYREGFADTHLGLVTRSAKIR